jgi:hypothetical protein
MISKIDSIRAGIASPPNQKKERDMNDNNQIGIRSLEEIRERDEWEFQEPISRPTDWSNRVLISISNHPVSQWPPEQLAAAGCVPVHIPFPAVAPTADEEEVLEIAGEIVEKVRKEMEKIMAANPAAAWDFSPRIMVMGEFTLTYAIVRRLTYEGCIPCAATTERIVEEQGGTKTSTFKFRRFRNYIV